MNDDTGGATTPPPSLPPQEAIDTVHYSFAYIVHNIKRDINQYEETSYTDRDISTALILAALKRAFKPGTPFHLYELVNAAEPEERWLIIGCCTPTKDVIDHVNAQSDVTPEDYYVEEHAPEIIRPKDGDAE